LDSEVPSLRALEVYESEEAFVVVETKILEEEEEGKEGGEESSDVGKNIN